MDYHEQTRLKDIQKNETNDRRLAHATLASYPWLQRLNCEAEQDVHPYNGGRGLAAASAGCSIWDRITEALITERETQHLAERSQCFVGGCGCLVGGWFAPTLLPLCRQIVLLR